MSILINLDNPGMLTPGATIMGTVVCRFHTGETIRGIECSLRGKEYTRWVIKSGRNSTTYIGDHPFISEDIICKGQGAMDVGVYEYPFVFKLPDGPIPSSYTHTFGSIRYYIKAKVDRPFAFDYEDSITLHVACPIDLNSMADQLQLSPVTYQFEEFPTCCCCTSEPVNMDLTINKEAFVIGDVITTKLHVHNTSDIRIEQIKMALVSHLKFTTEKPAKREKEEETEIVQKSEVGVRAQHENTYHFELRIPEILIPNFPNCYLIEQRWTVRAQVIFPTLHKNINSEVNIRLGHIGVGMTGVIEDIPASDTNIVAPHPTGGHPLPSAPLAEQEEGVPLIDQDAPSAPPPSYAEVTKHH